MFDRERARSLISRATAAQRAAASTLCFYRVAVVRDNPASAFALPVFPDLVDDVLAALRVRMKDSTAGVDFAGFARRFEEILGPDDAPFEEPYGLAAWAVDAVSLGDYALRTCSAPDRSDAACFDVLLASYSFAGMLEGQVGDVASPVLADLEFTRQMSDLEALISGVGVEGADFSALFAQSDPLRTLLAEQFQAVVDAAAGNDVS